MTTSLDAATGLTADVAAFIESADLSDVPASALDAAKRSLLDGLGLAVAGSRSEGPRLAQKMVSDYSAAGAEASVLGTSMRLPVRFAAFLNGMQIHADDFDDTQLAVAPDRVYGLLTHPTAPVLPVALALTERTDGSGADLLMSYLLGVEVATKTAEAINPRHYDDGFHATATLGAIGASASAIRILGLTGVEATRALGLAASQAGGVREHFGTMTKPFHAARAAESGIVAATLAGAGFTAAPNALEAQRGFFNAAGGGYATDAIHGVLGNPWTFEFPGVSIKPHPSGSLTHPGMSAFAKLIHDEDLRPGDVERITVGTNRHMPNALIHHRPQTELQAKFSMEFCLAILLLERRAGLAEFTDEVVLRDDVQEMIRRVDFGVDEAAEAAGYNTMTTNIRVLMKDGQVFETSAAFGRGSPQNPMPDSELVDKFAGCLEWGGVDPAIAPDIADIVFDLENQPSVAQLISRLVARA
ncbi:MmgE/PrpD family protein [Nocardioides sp. YIM 152315]|uniref:MmgE/PrpD family protein n=1 Tax=Nocardioides sp. YIM 152315 TaxID=3031760 RepID=UPI0023DB51F1|nr:MmgE/PrpD family protein [Nocardioides sp. YIM 152315]MDF1605827.1 MmgE/PrpD family protein [Nocardioides sp. YIM 152315]